MATNVYIDGFNLYRGCIRNSAYKWLDVSALCTALLPGHTINKIRYFTARIRPYSHDKDAPNRQQTYLRAIDTLPQVTLHTEGRYVARTQLLPQYPFAYRDPNLAPQMVQVRRMEEKRTDVDIASYLLLDCFADDFDEAVVITNDSDLITPIQVVKTQFGKRIGVINPHPPSGMSGALIKAASYSVREINKSVLAKSQFPPIVINSHGKAINKPPSW